MKITSLLIFLFLFSDFGFCQEEWELLTPFQGSNLSSIITSLDNTIYLRTLDSQVFRSTDNGLNWEAIEVPLDINIKSWNVSDDGTLYILYKEQVVKILPQSNTFTPLPAFDFSTESLIFLNIDVSQNGDVVIAPFNGEVHYLIHNTENWQSLSLSLFNERPKIFLDVNGRHLLFSGKEELYGFSLETGESEIIFDKPAIGRSDFGIDADLNLFHLWKGDLYRSIDDGENWVLLYDEDIFFSYLFISSGNRIYLWSTRNLHFSEDSGQTWTTFDIPPVNTNVASTLSIDSLSNNKDLIAFTSCDDQQFWLVDFETNEADDLFPALQYYGEHNLVADFGKNRLFGKSCGVDIQQSNSAGEQWSTYQVSSQGGRIGNVEKSLDKSLLMAITVRDSLYKSLDNGHSWINVTPDSGFVSLAYSRMRAIDENQLIVFTDNYFQYSSDGGLTWFYDPDFEFILTSSELFSHPDGYFAMVSGLHFALNNNSIITSHYDPLSHSWLTTESTNLSGISILYGIHDSYILPTGAIIVNLSDLNQLNRSNYISLDNGETFHEILETNRHLKSIISNKVGFLFATPKFSNEIFWSYDDGLTWSPYLIDLPFEDFRLYMDDDGFLYAIVDYIGIYRLKEKTIFPGNISGFLWSDSSMECDTLNDEEFRIPSWMVEAASSDNVFYAYTSAQGQYSFNLPIAEYTITPIINNPLYTLCPEIDVINIESDTTVELNIPILPIRNCPLLEISASTPFLRRCFSNTYHINICNNGTISSGALIASVTIDSFFNWVSSSIEPDNIQGNIYYFNQSSLAIGECFNFTVEIDVDCSASIGQEHCFLLGVNAINECSPPWSDTTVIECQQNIGSYDPNDKRAFINGKQVDEYFSPNADQLMYHIRFQNTGTDTAFTVEIVDTLSSSFDISTFNLESTSHPCRVEFEQLTDSIINKTLVRFVFDNIQLPDSTSNEPSSHGFVQFSIASTDTITLGTIISNVADIFFDFNEAVQTNIVRLNYDFQSTTTELRMDKLKIEVFPNPSSSVFYININNFKLFDQLYCQWFSVNGTLLYSTKIIDNKTAVDAREWPSGIYYYRVLNSKKLIYSGTTIKMN